MMGTSRGTTTDFDGNFSIEASQGDVLEISYVGFKTYTLTLADQTNLSVQLETDASELNEVVVVGYGTQKDLTLPALLLLLKVRILTRV